MCLSVSVMSLNTSLSTNDPCPDDQHMPFEASRDLRPDIEVCPRPKRTRRLAYAYPVTCSCLGSALEEFLKDAGAVPVRLSTIGSLGSSAPAPPSPTTSPSSSSRFDCPSPPLPASGFDPAPGPLVAWRRPVVHVLDVSTRARARCLT